MKHRLPELGVLAALLVAAACWGWAARSAPEPRGCGVADCLRWQDAVRMQQSRMQRPLDTRSEAILRNNLAWNLFLMKRPAEGMPQVQAALSLSPGDAPTLDTRGALLAQTGDWESAERDFAAAVRARPGDGELHAHHAVALGHLGRSEAALEVARTARRLPREVPARNEFCHLCAVFDGKAEVARVSSDVHLHPAESDPSILGP